LFSTGVAALVDAVDLKHIFGQINADRCNVHGGRSCSVQVVASHLHFGTWMPFMGGGVHPIAYGVRLRCV